MNLLKFTHNFFESFLDALSDFLWIMRNDDVISPLVVVISIDIFGFIYYFVSR